MISRLARRARWEAIFAPWAIASAGAAISAAFLFQPSLVARACMFCAFLAAAWLSGKRISIVTTILVSLGIVAANLLVPVGKVLAVLGPLRITEAALTEGIGKALVFEGLICVSKASILPGLRLPGRSGRLVAAAFVYYDRIVEYKGSVKPATFIEDADRLMLRVWEETRPEGTAPLDEAVDPATEPGPGHSRKLGAVALCVAVVASFSPLLLRL